MATTDDCIANLCEVMAAKYGAGADFRASLDEMVSKVREAHDRRMRDAQAAELLPLGREIAAQRLGVAPSTVYKMVHRFRRFRSTPDAAA